MLGYAPLVAEGNTATVYLTAEDWGVVADTLFHMETPKEILPTEILEYALVNQNQGIELKTSELTVTVERI